MRFNRIIPREVTDCLSDQGMEYIRFSPASWGYWAGQSLELENDETLIAELEATYQQLKSKGDPRT